MSSIKFGVVLPYGDPRVTARLAKEAEENGWDGIFVGDAIWRQDPLIQLAAAAMTTHRVRLGTMVLVTPLRQPWQIASTSLALDFLSNGRLTLGLGAGAAWMGWYAFPDTTTDTRARAEMLDETIDILTLMYQRKQFDYDGQHYHLKLTDLDLMHYPPEARERLHTWIEAGALFLMPPFRVEQVASWVMSYNLLHAAHEHDTIYIDNIELMVCVLGGKN